MDRVFGYGSLVNRDTHAMGGVPMTVRGWRRAWRHTTARPVAFLTAVRDAASTIEGLAADVPGGDWAALDRREAAYVRVPLPEGPSIYHIVAGHAAPTVRHPVLLSYVDTVVQGHLRLFGERGVARFFETTDGWDAPIRDDRAAPLYPRATALSDGERALVDRWLARVGARG